MRILVTGGAGFIGSHLVKALVQNNHDVIVLDNLSTGKQEYLPNEVMLLERDICKPDSFADLGSVDVIFHLAAQVNARASVEDPIHDADTNILGTVNVLEFAKNSDIQQIIFTSTCGVYGDQDQLPINETESCEPISGYGVSKYCAEQYIQLYDRLHKIPATIFRFANVYGPRQYRGENSGVISIFAHLAKEGSPLTVYGDGKQTRDYLAVQDIVDAFLLVLDNPSSNVVVYNLGTGEPTSLLDVIDMINKQLNRDVQVYFEDAKQGDILHSFLDISAIYQNLGWKSRLSLEEGIKKLLVD